MQAVDHLQVDGMLLQMLASGGTACANRSSAWGLACLSTDRQQALGTASTSILSNIEGLLLSPDVMDQQAACQAISSLGANSEPFCEAARQSQVLRPRLEELKWPDGGTAMLSLRDYTLRNWLIAALAAVPQPYAFVCNEAHPKARLGDLVSMTEKPAKKLDWAYRVNMLLERFCDR